MKAMIKSGTILFLILFSLGLQGQNPVIRDQFTADPSARVFDNKVYLYPSHDIPCTENRGRIGWFCMADYHVFSSENLTEWTDHGVIIDQQKVPWVDSTSYSMWAPDCIERNGRYYFYFPANSNVMDTVWKRKMFGIGVAVADKPYGPFIPQEEPIAGVRGIDPNVFIDKDQQAYLYWSARMIFMAKLKENMLELDSEPVVISNHLPITGLIEGPFMFERNGIYYLTYPHAADSTERLEYAVGSSPAGPFEFKGVIMDESPTGCWTNHHSIFEYRGQWYLFYHHNDYSPQFDKNRSVRIDSLFFNEDGTIRKVTPTLRGVGLTRADEKIEIDRYSDISKTGVSIEFLDTLNKFLGWKTTLTGSGSWVQYNAVDFGDKKYKTIKMKARSAPGGTLEFRAGTAFFEVKVPVSDEWIIIVSRIPKQKQKTGNLKVTLKDGGEVDIDWVSFGTEKK